MDAKEIKWVKPYTTTRYLHKGDIIEWLKNKGLINEAEELESSEGTNNAPKNTLHPHLIVQRKSLLKNKGLK